MALVKVASVGAVPSGEMIEVKVGERVLALCNVEGRLHAIEGTCPHLDGPLGQGALHGNTVVCPWHAWEFDCRTGENDRNPDVKLATFPVRVEGDDIVIELD